MECLEPRLALSGLDITFDVKNAHYSPANTYVTFIGGSELSATYNGGHNSIVVNHSYTIKELKGVIHLNKYVSGRIFVSLGEGVAGTKPPEMTNPDIRSYHVRFDKIELTYQATDPNSCANLTAVDFSAVPLQVKTFKGHQQLDVLTYNIPYMAVKVALGNLTNNKSSVVLVDSKTQEFLRVLAPHTNAVDYASMAPYINAVKDWQTTTGFSTTIDGHYSGRKPNSTPATQAQNYHFTATVEADGSLKMVGGGTVVGGNHTIVVPAASLPKAIYLGNASDWTVDGVVHSFDDNDVYCAAFRDILGGFNLGFVASPTMDKPNGKTFGEESSANWWSSKNAFDYLQPNPAFYNNYAKIVTTYSDAYSWAFSDLWSHVQAKLNETNAKADTMQITVLPDYNMGGPTIGSVVTASARGYMSWNSQDSDGVASSGLTIDGVRVSTIYGPYPDVFGVTSYGRFGTLSNGIHSYAITATDTLGNTSKKTGTFEVTPNTGPTIGSVVIVAEKGFMTWNAQDTDNVATSTLRIDGALVSKVRGPYWATAGVNFSGRFGALSTGTHRYTITATDTLGHSTQKTGTFEAVPLTGPTIGSVVIVPGRGLMTWNAQDLVGVAGATLKVDGVAVSRIFGPHLASWGVDYGGLFGTLSTGTHHYTITATNRYGYSSQRTGTFEIAGLTIDSSVAPREEAALLFDRHLAPVAAAALRRLETQWGGYVETAMAGVSIRVASLAPGVLGETFGKTILIDDDAAGYGWFVDSTPDEDVEFAGSLAQRALAAGQGSSAANRVDLLTAVMHEMGHVLGRGHSDSLDLMAPTLALGIRETA